MATVVSTYTIVSKIQAAVGKTFVVDIFPFEGVSTLYLQAVPGNGYVPVQERVPHSAKFYVGCGHGRVYNKSLDLLGTGSWCFQKNQSSVGIGQKSNAETQLQAWTFFPDPSRQYTIIKTPGGVLTATPGTAIGKEYALSIQPEDDSLPDTQLWLFQALLGETVELGEDCLEPQGAQTWHHVADSCGQGWWNPACPGATSTCNQCTGTSPCICAHTI
jgi:hypothetical protein